MDTRNQSGYLCHPMQRYTLRRVTLEEGKARGVQVIEVVTAGGLQVDILPDTGLDIGQVRYRGVNVTFLSKNGYDSPAAFLPYEQEFLHTFPGGLVYTGGMRSTGGAHRDGEEWHPLHGRFHGLPAQEVAAYMEGGEIVVRGVIRETALFGHCLEARRIIRIPADGADIALEDEITNLAYAPEGCALLYHCNFGWPLVCQGAELRLPPERRTIPRTPFAAQGLDRACQLDAPVPLEEERVFFHRDMPPVAVLRNRALDISVTLRWSDSLPILSHWRSMAAGDYALGLEPSNTYLMGRKQERENGTLPMLAPGETLRAGVAFHFDNTTTEGDPCQ